MSVRDEIVNAMLWLLNLCPKAAVDLTSLSPERFDAMYMRSIGDFSGYVYKCVPPRLKTVLRTLIVERCACKRQIGDVRSILEDAVDDILLDGQMPVINADKILPIEVVRAHQASDDVSGASFDASNDTTDIASDMTDEESASIAKEAADDFIPGVKYDLPLHNVPSDTLIQFGEEGAAND